MYLEKEEMKFAVLYAVKQYKAPISMSLTYEIFTWDKEIMEYFDLSEVLAELLEQAFCLTESGEAAYLYFKGRIPYSRRERIDEAIGKAKYDEIVDPNAVKAEVVLAAEEQYMARCSILEDKVPMMELSINMGKKIHAERVAEYFKKNSKRIYEEILKLCVEDIK